MSGPPAVVCQDPAQLHDAAAVLGASGWTLRDDFGLPDEPWDLTRRRWACRGTVTSEDDAAAAI